jgi:glucose-6-phosphate 1-dehydrogenase
MKKKMYFIIFGANGDLTKRKLLPALYNIKNKTQNSPEIIATGRRAYTTKDYINETKEPVSSFLKQDYDKEKTEEFLNAIEYQRIEFNDKETFISLKDFLSKQNNIEDIDIIYYLATAPEFFETVSQNLREAGLTESKNSVRRAVFEKPFGRSLENASKLNSSLSSVFSEKNIYRIDHYLGKEMLQNILFIRFANCIFEPLWSKNHIESIEIISEETQGIGTRGGYYEESGALKDMIQNHLMQMLSLIAMEPPEKINAEHIKAEKLKVFKSMKLYDKNPEDCIIRGQYTAGEINGKKVPAYRDEEKVSKESMTETYVSLKLRLDNDRWQGVPVYMHHGKRMPRTGSEIRINFKSCSCEGYFEKMPQPNILIIKVQPDGGIYFRINAKEAGTENSIIPISLDYCHACQNIGNIPEAYEVLIKDSLEGEKMLFTGWEELKATWQFTDTISEAFKTDKIKMNFYKAGTKPE